MKSHLSKGRSAKSDSNTLVHWLPTLLMLSVARKAKSELVSGMIWYPSPLLCYAQGEWERDTVGEEGCKSFVFRFSQMMFSLQGAR